MTTLAAVRRERGKRAILKPKYQQDRQIPHDGPHTRELAQHHDVEVPGKLVATHRIKTRLDGLFQARDEKGNRLINAAEWQAGDRYRTDYEVGELGGNSRELGDFTSGGSSGGCPTQARLDALRRLALARRALTPDQCAAVTGLAVDLSWGAMALMLHCSDKTAKTRVVEALKRLAAHYRLVNDKAPMRAVEMGR